MQPQAATHILLLPLLLLLLVLLPVLLHGLALEHRGAHREVTGHVHADAQLGSQARETVHTLQTHLAEGEWVCKCKCKSIFIGPLKRY
jgi:hypothetical protein